MKTLCIYHGNCADGFGAAWVVRRALGDDVEFHAGVYQDPPPDVTGRDVVLVDFSYKRDVIARMAETAKSIVIIDHHKSAQEDLQGIESHLAGIEAAGGPPTCRVDARFDMNHSGAMLAWLTFFPNDPPPALLEHIEDRDLWRFKFPGTREIQATVFSYPYDFAVWDKLMDTPVLELLIEGKAIERKHFKDIEELVKVVTRRMVIGGHNIPVANLPYTLTSDAGHLLARGEPFAACYWDTPDGRVFSLRSADGIIDVSEIAKQYGGGGHRSASGFRVTYAKAATFEVSP